MSHPRNKRERFLTGKRKGNIRAKGIGTHMSEECLNKTSVLLRETTKLCSCHMCGNPRKFFQEKTLQEMREDSAER